MIYIYNVLKSILTTFINIYIILYNIFMEVEILPSTRKTKKLMALFYKDNKLIKTVHFGAKGYKDFTIYSKGNKENAEKIKASYLKRHSVRENWADYMTAGSLSRYILWNRPTIAQSIGVYLKTFNLKYKK